MSDLLLALTCLLAVLSAGALRAYVDKNIGIFYITAFAVAVMALPLALEKFDIIIPDGFLILFATILLVLAKLIDQPPKAHNYKCLR